MYKVCFVDDETINYQLFEKLVNWEEKGFVIAGTAGDGLQALQLYEAVQPDLILMDIQLPFMDGLECVRCIREEDKNVQIVIVSAYGEFSYAQKAIHYGVQDFLLKPVSRIMLNQIVDKVKQTLDAGHDQAMAGDLFHNEVTSILFQILHQGEGLHQQVQVEALKDVGLLCRIIITSPDGSRLSVEEIKKIIGEKITESRLSDGLKAILVLPDSSVYIAWERGRQIPFTDLLKAGSGKNELYVWEEGIESIEAWLEKAANEANYGFYETESRQYKAWVRPFTEAELDMSQADTVIFRSLAENKAEILYTYVNDCFSEACFRQLHPDLLKNFVLDMLVKIKFSLSRFDQKESFSIMRNIRMEEINNILSVTRLQTFLEKKIEEMFSELALHMYQPGRGKHIVFQANAFAELYFGDTDFSVQKAADSIGISKNYFTSLYKERAGISFWDYVTQLRMKRARDLLLSTDQTIGNIARAVGYESEYHFSRKFKEYVGLSPNQFRRSV